MSSGFLKKFCFEAGAAAVKRYKTLYTAVSRVLSRQKEFLGLLGFGDGRTAQEDAANYFQILIWAKDEKTGALCVFLPDPKKTVKVY